MSNTDIDVTVWQWVSQSFSQTVSLSRIDNACCGKFDDRHRDRLGKRNRVRPFHSLFRDRLAVSTTQADYDLAPLYRKERHLYHHHIKRSHVLKSASRAFYYPTHKALSPPLVLLRFFLGIYICEVCTTNNDNNIINSSECSHLLYILQDMHASHVSHLTTSSPLTIFHFLHRSSQCSSGNLSLSLSEDYTEAKKRISTPLLCSAMNRIEWNGW